LKNYVQYQPINLVSIVNITLNYELKKNTCVPFTEAVSSRANKLKYFVYNMD